MDWLDELGQVAGPLAPAARAFAKRRGVPLPKGADAIRALSDAIDALVFGEEGAASDAADQALVEEGGALLAVVLIDRYGGAHAQRGPAHRVLLGDHGCFDPFRAIDACLDADDPDKELRARLQAAEAEVRGDGPTARVVGAFAAALREARPDVAIVSRFDFELTLDLGVEVDLQRVAEVGEDAGARRGAVARVLALLPGADAPAPLGFEEVAELLLPRLVGAKFLADLGERSDALFQMSLAADLVITLQLRYPGRARFVRAEEASRWAVNEPLRHALGRLERAGPARFERADDLLLARTGDGLDAARVLCPALWWSLRDALGGEPVVAVPHRDTIVAGLQDGAVEGVARDAMARAPHPISAALLRRADVLGALA